MTTLIVTYSGDPALEKFMKDNKDVLQDFTVITVEQRGAVYGISVEVLPQ